MSYDSDSDVDDECTETNVLLGYASKEPSEDDTISYLGGTPTWLDPTTPPSASLAKCKVCNDMMVLLLQLNGDLPEVFHGHERRLYVFSCRRAACRRKGGCVRALRGTRIAESAGRSNKTSLGGGKSVEREEKVEKAENTPMINIGETLFGTKVTEGSSMSNPFSTNTSGTSTNPFSTNSLASNSNPFTSATVSTSELAAKPPQAPSPAPPSTNTNTTAKSTLPQTFASILALNSPTPPNSSDSPSPPQPWPPTTSLPLPYPLSYLSEADYEILDRAPFNVPIPSQTMDLDDSGGTSGKEKEDKEVFESTIDTTFQKFADRVAQNPEQVIRYEFRGTPLLYSKKDTVGRMVSSLVPERENVKVTTATTVGGGDGGKGIPRCANCGAGRVFEVQLMPHAIMVLESEEMGVDGMEWGTVIVGVCERDCVPKGVAEGDVGYVEEWAGVQWEEMK